VIGPTGRNFAAGMSGGVAYVYDGPINGYAGGQFPSLCNQDMVSLEPLSQDADKAFVRRTLEDHVKYTDSPVARAILESWESELRYFVRVMPNDYKRVLDNIAAIEAKAAEALSNLQGSAAGAAR
jgi:glutamate synthase domain-containing protein 3